MRFEEYRRFDAVALAGLVSKGEVSAGELLDVAIARAEAVACSNIFQSAAE